MKKNMNYTELLDILYDRLVNGEWRDFLDEALGNIKRSIESLPYPQGYRSRVRELETIKSSIMCELK